MMGLLAQTTPSLDNPALGVMIFVLGGLAGAIFYLPFKRVRRWAWESYWLVYAVAGLIVVPWALAMVTSPNVFSVLRSSPGEELGLCLFCGAMWGFGGLTWGLMIRYLGVGLGLAIGAGLCSAAGTLIPPICAGTFLDLLQTSAGQVSLAAVVVSLVGIVLVGGAGMSKEAELPEEAKKAAVAEFDFKKGVVVAVFSGLMSAGMNFGLQGGPNIQELAGTIEPATAPAWCGMPVLVVVLLGGFLVNAIWCLGLNLKNRTLGDYLKPDVPRAANLFWAGLAGAIWCSQFVCQKTGEPLLGSVHYISFSVVMASAILFSTMLGIFLGEWKGTSGRTRKLLAAGLLFLVGSSALSGVSGYLKG
jgi:L-rhamnose-H+ transport protein